MAVVVLAVTSVEGVRTKARTRPPVNTAAETRYQGEETIHSRIPGTVTTLAGRMSAGEDHRANREPHEGSGYTGSPSSTARAEAGLFQALGTGKGVRPNSLR